jgi:hypothetical protein
MMGTTTALHRHHATNGQLRAPSQELIAVHLSVGDKPATRINRMNLDD